MSTDKKRVLVVDDSPTDIQFVMQNLKDEYAILVATNGPKGLEIAANEPKPDVILLDVMMEGMNGYEVCRALKDNPETQDIDVIFISAHDTLDEKLTGYDAGGSDYLIKPVQPGLLQQKVKLAMLNKQQRQAALEERNEAFNVAMSAVYSAGELGLVLQFLRNSFTVDSIENLAKAVISILTEFELSGTVQLSYYKGLYYFGSSNPIPPLEKELLNGLNAVNRINEHRNRAFFNFGNVSLLVKNMPEEEELRGRLRDHIAILLEGAESKLISLEKEMQLADLVVDANQALANIADKQLAYKKEGQSLVDQLLVSLEETFIAWGLDEAQENKLIALVENGINRSLDHLEEGLDLDEEMREIIKRLSAI